MWFFEGEEGEIMRGTWYYDGSWIPLKIEHSKVIEEIHLNLFQREGNNQNDSKCETNSLQPSKGIFLIWINFLSFVSNSILNCCFLSVLHTEQFPEFHVDWHTISDVTLYSEYTHSKLMRSVTSKLGFSKSK